MSTSVKNVLGFRNKSKQCTLVANIMARDRWELIKKHLHFNDNSLIFEQDPANPNRLFKIQPVIDHLLPKFQSIPQQQVLCCDEQMIPFKGHSALKQYMPKKTYKWGYKVYMLCDTTEMVHNFEIYAEKYYLQLVFRIWEHLQSSFFDLLAC